MDTLEAYITFQEAVTFFNDNELFLIKAVQNVENYLWFNDVPIGLEPSIRPEDYRSFFLAKNLDYIDIQDFNHPKITAKINKLSLYEIEQRLKREKLKPKLKFKYNPLLTTSENVNIHEVALSNYKLGFDLSMPIFFRKERAAAQKGALKIQEIEWDIEFKKNELFNKMEASWEQQALLRDQIKVINQIVENYKRLLEGENEKFNYGESSVFLLNKRQEKYINGQLKLTGTYIKQQVEILNFLYYSNQLIPR